MNSSRPPWEAFPDVPRFSIGWRMGEPETYLMQWHAMYDQLNKWQRREYRRKHRRPALLWLGFYAMCSHSRWIVAAGIWGTLVAYFTLFAFRVISGPFGASRVKLD